MQKLSTLDLSVEPQELKKNSKERQEYQNKFNAWSRQKSMWIRLKSSQNRDKYENVTAEKSANTNIV